MPGHNDNSQAIDVASTARAPDGQCLDRRRDRHGRLAHLRRKNETYARWWLAQIWPKARAYLAEEARPRKEPYVSLFDTQLGVRIHLPVSVLWSHAVPGARASTTGLVRWGDFAVPEGIAAVVVEARAHRLHARDRRPDDPAARPLFSQTQVNE